MLLIKLSYVIPVTCAIPHNVVSTQRSGDNETTRNRQATIWKTQATWVTPATVIRKATWVARRNRTVQPMTTTQINEGKFDKLSLLFPNMSQ